MAHPKACPRRLVHLPEHHHGFTQNPGLLYLPVDLLGLPGALANAAENADTLVLTDDIIDEFRDEHGLAHPGPTEEPRLAATLQGGEQVQGLDPCLQNLGLRAAFSQ